LIKGEGKVVPVL